MNDILLALLKRNASLYADDITKFYQPKDVNEIEPTLNKEFGSLCEWFANNKLSIHFGRSKTKCVLLIRRKDLSELNAVYDNNKITMPLYMAKHLGCYFESKLSRESMTWNFLKKINAKLQVLYQQNMS